MATEEEIQRMVVRLIGDDQNYQEMLKRSHRLTKEWQAEMEGARAHTSGIGDDLAHIEGNMSDVGVAAAGAGAAMFAVASAVAAVTLAAKVLQDSWSATVNEINKGADASVFFSQRVVDAINEGEKAIKDMRDEYKRMQADMSATIAPAVTYMANRLEDAVYLMRLLPSLTYLGTEDTFDRQVQEIAAADRRRRELIEAEAQLLRDKEQAAVEERARGLVGGNVNSLQSKLDALTMPPELVAIRQLERELAELGQTLSAEDRLRIEHLQNEVKLREQINSAIKEAARKAEEIQRAEAAAAKQRIAFEKQLAPMRERLAEVQGKQGAGNSMIQEILASGVPISAGAAIEAGTVEARSATKFGSAGDTMSKLLKELTGLSKEEVKIQGQIHNAIKNAQQPQVVAIP